MLNVSKLANNLQIASWHMPHAKSVTINILVKVGSRYENDQQHGICHFLEHMAFKGTTTRSYQQIAQSFDLIGGQFNACTSREHTVYYAKVLTQHLSEAMNLLSDILQNSIYEKSEINKEREVILQEIAQYQDSPEDLAYDNLIQEAFAGQAIGKSILGTVQTLATFTTENFAQYVEDNYTADNMIISAAGNVNHQELVLLSQSLFANLAQKQARTYPKAYNTQGGKIITKDLEQVNLLLGFAGVSYMNKAQYYKAQILSIILGGGISSRLFQSIREKHGLVYSVGSFHSAYSDAGLFCIHGSTSAENITKFITQTKIEVESICQAIELSELERAKEQIRIGLLMAEEKSSYIAEDLAKSFAIFGQYQTTEEILTQINSFTCQDITAMACQIFSNQVVISSVGPKSSLVLEEVCQEFQNLKQS
jgi:predicted Zn-dependent peptidase